MQVRLLLEPQVATLAARIATQADLSRITECLDAGGACDDFESFETWDARLHRAIAQAAHNGLLMSAATCRTFPTTSSAATDGTAMSLVVVAGLP